MLLQKHSAELKAAGTVLVIGGGAVGVELAGKLPHLSVHVHLPVCMSVCPSAARLSTCLSI
jgi:NADH dehydrogenase FAD-containing subunit